MKKSQSIFLLSGLVPLVAAPIAIVASCSNDTTAVKTETQQEIDRLNKDVIQSSKLKIKEGTVFNDDQLKALKAEPNKLLTDYLDKTELGLKEDKFNYEIVDLAGVEPKQDATPQAKTMNFKFKVTNKQTTSEAALISSQATVAYQYQQGAAVENPALAKAVTTIETAHNNKSFKLKAAKATMTEADVTKLTTDPNFLLKDEFTDGFPQLDQGITPSINKTNFQIVDRKQSQGTTNKTIQFKVTVSDAQKVEKETKQLTFDFTLQTATQPTQKLETRVKSEINVTDLELTPSTPNKDQIKNLVNAAKILEKKDVIFQQGQELITDQADITNVQLEEINTDATKITLKFKVANGKWYNSTGQVGSGEKELTLTITNLSTT